MSLGDLALSSQAERTDVVMAANELVSELMFRPWGTVSPSVYETGRMVTLAPWLIGHAERVEYLLATQRPDGGWGRADGYGLVPTLSATEAILSVLGNGESSTSHELLIQAAGRGLRRLVPSLSESSKRALPDMPAIELIVPSLIELINAHLDRQRAGSSGDVVGWLPTGRLQAPAGLNDAMLVLIRSVIESGARVPEKLLHALEVAGDAASGAPTVRPSSIGTVGASPAASAAWLSDRGRLDPGNPVRRHLEAVAVRHGGPVPVGFPITVFERGWVLSWLARAGLPVDVPPEMVADLRAAIGPEGTPAGPGLPSDADTTSVALYALALLGMPYKPDCLWSFETETHFCTWPGEQGFSSTVNAHVLDAFGEYLVRCPGAGPRYRAAIDKLVILLHDHQRPDGSWADRWHASPYYATVGCALALDEFGGDGSKGAVRRAVQWVLDTQRPDGSWGRWDGTMEETAYAMQILLMTRATVNPRCAVAAARGQAFILRSTGTASDPPLWHDKDLYLPVAIVRAAVLAAVHLAQSDSALVALQK